MSLASLRDKLFRKRRLYKYLLTDSPKLYLGCGDTHQDGYINVDIRPTPAADLVADINWCLKHLASKCSEVYLSHILEHLSQPGQSMRDTPGTVLHFMRQANNLLAPGGILRVAVPDFEALARLYVEENHPLHPRLLDRICGGQTYPENLHKCVFDRAFLTTCFHATGFTGIRTWNPRDLGLARDASFDEINNTPTSLNLCATKA